jgi:hypothetical protein
MSLNLNSKPGSDLEGDARQSADLQIAERMPQIKIRPMIHTSDNELYLRLGIPDGLQNDGTHEEHYSIVQQAHRDPSRSAIKSESGE